ncbi:MAG: DUF5343 domain-containing protein [Gemmatimonadetes bacterium]|nr:DUF5343 domain-containing protein [Gemmatimonadota bacterium]
MENPNIDSEEREQDAAEEALADSQEGKNDSRPWYPYITKAQFEKFLARLQSRIPDEIHRDYIRAIIRTPSMIHRFLRGIEAMKLIDGDQKPTDRLQKLVAQDTRARAVDEILEDLYPELLKEYRANGEMADRDIVSFFRKETGMGNDSANKMKMFFKYLISCTDSDGEASSAEAGNGSPAASAPPAQSPPRADRERGERERGERERGSSSRSGQQSRGQESSGSGSSGGSRTLSEAQRAYLDTLKAVLKVNIDGDWDDDMIKLAFDRLERLFDRVRRG